MSDVIKRVGVFLCGFCLTKTNKLVSVCGGPLLVEIIRYVVYVISKCYKTLTLPGRC